MLKLFALLTLTFLGFGIAAQSTSLTIKVSDIRSEEGLILIAVFNDAEQFMEEEGRYRELTIMPEKGMVQKTVVLPPGKYAVAVLHDLDGNEKMSTTIFGVPDEGYGYSNNPGKRLTDPPFKTCEIVVGENSKTIEIDLVYW